MPIWATHASLISQIRETAKRGRATMAFEDQELLRKIQRIRAEWWQVDLVLMKAGARSPSKNTLLKDAPQIVALFDEYGRDAVLAAVKESNAHLAAVLMRVINSDDRGRG